MNNLKCAIVLSLVLCILCDVNAKCAFRSECIEILGHAKPCAFDEEPPLLLSGVSEEEGAELINIIETRCPFLLYDEDGNRKDNNEIFTCCDSIQLKGMAESLLLADGVLGRCPRCIRNFVRQICEMTCSPNQTRFLDVVTETDPTTGIEYVNEINYRLYEDFMLNAYESCAGVYLPQTGMPAVNMMCGNAPVCNAEAFFSFTGDTQSNPITPIQINFYKWPTPEDSMNAEAPPCNETAEGDVPCGCMDCYLNCAESDGPQVESMCTVLSVNCIGFSVGIAIFVVTVTFFAILTLLEYKKLRSGNFGNTDIKYTYKINVIIKTFQNFFEKTGAICADNPIIIIMITTWVVFGMVYGVTKVNMTVKPLELWSAPESRTRHELNYFNSRFGPFYRAAQVFLTVKGLDDFVVGNITYGPAYRLEVIQELIQLEKAIIDIGRDREDSVKLENVCYAPLRARGEEPHIDQCVSMSVATYFPNREVYNQTYLNNIQNCLNNYLSFGCLASWGGGADPEMAIGGYEDNILLAHTLLLNFPISNQLSEEELAPVMEWEGKFIDLMHDYEENWKSDYIDVAFGTEKSIEDEIQRISEAETIPILISYILMFIYVIFALGNRRGWRTCLIDSKVTVAICSILVVLAAIFCALGVLGYAQITITLLAVNVIPFFVLSIGIDNVFLMVNSLQDIENKLKDYDDYDQNFSFEKKRSFVFSKMMIEVGPSMFVSSITQITCFGIGSLAQFPAVRSFALFATFSLAFLFIFQITTVVAILSLDYKKVQQNRLDLLCCIRKTTSSDEELLHDSKHYQSITQKLMKPYADFLLNWRVKIIVVILFIALLSISIIWIPQIEVGLDQEMALPVDSYVYKYLQAVNQIMVIGPPVFFVLKGGLNFTDHNHQNVICGSQLCNIDSLATQIFLAARYSNITYISRSSNSWLDDFFDWATLPGVCCQYNKTSGGYCPSDSHDEECEYCSIETSEYGNGLRPSDDAFYKYIPFFLQDAPTETCNKGGLASYYSNVNYILDSEGRAIVQDTNFMAFHSTLETSTDYIMAVKYAYEVSDAITDSIKNSTGLDVEVFPYSVFFVYYEQYLTMWPDTITFIAYCLAGALVINLLVTGFNIFISVTLMITVIMVIVDMMGIMWLWSIQLNAVSCINLIVSIGISVEYCSHLAYAYATSTLPPSEKVSDALQRVGATIITGITLTNIPIVVLAFSYTEIIEVFFFRMLFSLVILGFLHGMIFFPVFLSYMNDIRYR